MMLHKFHLTLSVVFLMFASVMLIGLFVANSGYTHGVILFLFTFVMGVLLFTASKGKKSSDSENNQPNFNGKKQPL